METFSTCNPDELMMCIAADQIRNGELVIIGTGLPMLAATLAKKTHARDAVMFYESGAIDTDSLEAPLSVVDPRVIFGATCFCSLFKSLGLLQRGLVDVGFLGGAEVDVYGNLNATALGDYYHPKIRLPGSGGANDIASMAKRVVIMMKHERRRFPERVGYVTSPGFLEGGESRKKKGLKGGGPALLISDLGVFDFQEETRRMRVQSLHPGVSEKSVREATGFELVWPKTVSTTPLPPSDKLETIRKLDPKKIFLH